MNWRVGGPVATLVMLIAATWAGILLEDQDERLAALLYGLATFLLGVFTTMVIVQWWKDGGKDD